MTRIAFLGLGRMGTPMAHQLVAHGHELTVWNRTRATAQAFAAEHTCGVAATPAEAAAGAAVVISMLADDLAVEASYVGPDRALASMGRDSVAVDMSTISPAMVARLHTAAEEQGTAFVDAPVSGSVAAATAGSLTIMLAGDEPARDRARPVLADLGRLVVDVGPSGAGASLKLAVNAILHSLNGAVSEALVLAEQAGIERKTAYAVFLESAIAAPFVHYRQSSFETPEAVPVGFRLALAAKDIRLAVDLADQVGAPLPQARANLEVLESAIASGYEDRDETALADFFRARPQD